LWQTKRIIKESLLFLTLERLQSVILSLFTIPTINSNLEIVFIFAGQLNSNSRPDKYSIVNVMTNQIKDVELKEFIQDSIDECFDTLELGKSLKTLEIIAKYNICNINEFLSYEFAIDFIYTDSHNNKCEFSKNFAVCMESKAQRVNILKQLQFMYSLKFKYSSTNEWYIIHNMPAIFYVELRRLG